MWDALLERERCWRYSLVVGHFCGMHRALGGGIAYHTHTHTHTNIKMLVIWSSSSSVSIKHNHGGYNRSRWIVNSRGICICFPRTLRYTWPKPLKRVGLFGLTVWKACWQKSLVICSQGQKAEKCVNACAQLTVFHSCPWPGSWGGAAHIQCESSWLS